MAHKPLTITLAAALVAVIVGATVLGSAGDRISDALAKDDDHRTGKSSNPAGSAAGAGSVDDVDVDTPLAEPHLVWVPEHPVEGAIVSLRVESDTPLREKTMWLWTFEGSQPILAHRVDRRFGTAGDFPVHVQGVLQTGQQVSLSGVVQVAKHEEVPEVPNAAFRVTGDRLHVTLTPVEIIAGARYLWSFGDGTTAESRGAIEHNYAAPGDFEIRLRVITPDGLYSDDQYVLRTQLDAPAYIAHYGTAQDSASRTHGSEDDVVKQDPEVRIACGMKQGFTMLAAANFFAIDIPFDSIAWDFGDGVSANTQVAEHTYGFIGPYTVSVTVTFRNGLTLSHTRYDCFEAPPLEIDFFWDIHGMAVYFQPQVAGVTWDNIAGFFWEFGHNVTPPPPPGTPGIPATSTLDFPINVFPAPKTYTVNLTVFAEDGRVGFIDHAVKVDTPDPLEIDFTWEQVPYFMENGRKVPMSLDVQFQATATGEEPAYVTFEWTFKDGSPPVGGWAPRHTFPLPSMPVWPPPEPMPAGWTPPEPVYNVTLTGRTVDGRVGQWVSPYPGPLYQKKLDIVNHTVLVDVPRYCPPDLPPAQPTEVTIVALIDTGINAYHWDFLQEFMPSFQDGDPSNDLPLCNPPDQWIPGFPDPSTFASYEPMNLRLDTQRPDERAVLLHNLDQEEWEKMEQSSYETGSPNPNAGVHYRWIPGTKIVGLLNFGNAPTVYSPPPPDGPMPPYADSADPEPTNDMFEYGGSHGTGVASVSTGNFHGTCPNCVLVFTDLNPAGSEWSARQPWIDVQSNSWGPNTLPGLLMCGGPIVPVECRESIVSCPTEWSRAAIKRGQAVFFASGNGVDNGYTVEQNTLLQCYSGPDWQITVGGIDPTGAIIDGTGKPVDIASLGVGYPSAYGGLGQFTLNYTDMFSGTSNATPVTAGTYARALDDLRHTYDTLDKTQTAGVIHRGPPGCGAALPNCPMFDGRLTVREMTMALFHAAEHTQLAGPTESGADSAPGAVATSNPTESVFISMGHGAIFGKVRGVNRWQVENARITGYVNGNWGTLTDDLGEWADPASPATPAEIRDQLKDYMVSDSYCRQKIWGNWRSNTELLGYYDPAQPASQLAPEDPDWPWRTTMGYYNPAAPGPPPDFQPGAAQDKCPPADSNRAPGY